MEKHTFQNEYNYSKKAVKKVIWFLQAVKEIEVKDVQKNKDYFDLDIDLIQADGLTIEVKSERYWMSGNLAAETISNKTKGTIGCWYKTKSDVLIDYFGDIDVLYYLPTKLCQEYLKKVDEEDKYRRVYTKTTDFKGNELYENECILIPALDLIQYIVEKTGITKGFVNQFNYATNKWEDVTHIYIYCILHPEEKDNIHKKLLRIEEAME